jgi:aryl-alcohol dehydrogenase-like predicted oxidoreductase
VEEAERSLNASLTRLKTDYVDILFLHEPSPALIGSDEFLVWLEAQRTKGKIRYWGLAGDVSQFVEWIRGIHPLATILQTNDSLERREADVILRQGKHLQFTYGYMSSSCRRGGKPDVAFLLEVLQRNKEGSIIFSTRRSDRIGELASLIR